VSNGMKILFILSLDSGPVSSESQHPGLGDNLCAKRFVRQTVPIRQKTNPVFQVRRHKDEVQFFSEFFLSDCLDIHFLYLLLSSKPFFVP
jgi:hypothetical protein